MNEKEWLAMVDAQIKANEEKLMAELIARLKGN